MNATGTNGAVRRQAQRWPWLMGLVLFVAVVLTATSIHGVIEGWVWLPPAAVTAAVVLLATTLARMLRLPLLLVPVVGVGALTGILTLLFLPAASLFGFIPTAATWHRLVPMLERAGEAVVTQLAPVTYVDGIVLLTCAGVGFVALLLDTLVCSAQIPAAGGLALLAILVVPAIVKPDSVGAPAFTAAIVGYLLILGSAHAIFDAGGQRSARAPSSSQLGRGLAIGVLAIAGALIVPAAVPGFSTGVFPQGSRINLWGQATGLNPMVTLGDDLRRPEGTGRITYSTSAAEAPYLRSATIEDFSGRSWAPDLNNDSRRTGVGWLPSPFPTGSEAADPIVTTITTGTFTSPWLPAPYAPVGVDGLRGRWSWDPGTRTIKAIGTADTAHQEYTVRSEQLDPSRTTLLSASGNPTADVAPGFLSLPGTVPDIISKTAHRISARAGTPYTKAMAIQGYLRSIDFVYSEEAPVKGGYDGSGLEVVAKFLEAKSGYCIHYAAAMAVMARVEGIPSRIAVGYAPGHATGITSVRADGTELTQYEVDSSDAHAWPELYFEGLGWVRFEPTPSRGVVPDWALDATAPAPPDTHPQNLSPNNRTRPDTQPGPDVAGPESVTNDQEQPSASPSLVIPLLVLLALALLAAPAVVRSRIRRRRLSRLAVEGKDHALIAWAEINDTAVDLRLGAGPGQTARDFRGGLTDRQLLSDEAAAAMDRLVNDYEHAVYGRPDGPAPTESGSGAGAGAGTMTTVGAAPQVGAATPHAGPHRGPHRDGDVQLVRRSLVHNSSHKQRLLGRWLPASLLLDQQRRPAPPRRP